MSLLQGIAECFGFCRPSGQTDSTLSDKPCALHSADRTEQDIAHDIVIILTSSEKRGDELDRKLQSIVGTNGWTANLAAAILEALETTLNQVPKESLGQTMRDALNTVIDTTTDFVSEHPVCTALLALGVLVLLMPWIIEAVGFGAYGPIEGTFATLWQARYLGYVPKGSWFSFFQRLGMMWK